MPPINPYQQQMQPWNMGFQNPYAQGQTPDLMLLNQLSQGFAPVMTMPQQQMRTGFEQLPGFNNPGLVGMGLNMFAAPMLQQQMSKFGMVPGGMAPQNIMDFMQANQFQTQQQEMLGRIAQDTTQQGVVSFARGMAEMTGREFDAPQRQAARQMGSMVATAAPMLAQMMPDQMDAMSGRRGSAVVMAQRMSNTNRFRMDPVTGLMGQDPETTEQQARILFDEMYADENMSRMRGVRAGEMGGLYTALAQRGMLGADQRSMPLRTAEAAANVMAGGGPARQRVLDALGPGAPRTAEGGVDFGALTPDQMTNLTNQTDVSTQLRAFDANKVKTSLEGYVDVVSTMKEIFGEAGRTDAPMNELIQSLEALSQGGLTQVSPGRLNQMVRTTAQLAQTSGMTLDAAIMMQQQAGGQLQARGMNTVQASQMTQGSMGFGQAFTAQGALANPTWGLNDANAQRQLDQTLRIQAADSPMANAMATILRAEQSLDGGYEEGSEAAAMAAALNEGRTTYIHDGQTKSFSNMTPHRATELISSGSGGDISRANARQFLLQTGANDEVVFEKDLGNLTRRLQPEQIGRKLYERTARNQASQFFLQEGRGRNPEMADNIGSAVSRAMQGMTAEERTDPDIRRRIMQDAIMDASGGTIGRDDARVQADLMWGQMEEKVSGDFADPRYSGYGSLQNLMLQQDESTINLGTRQQRVQEINASIKNDLSGLTGGSFLGNMIDAVHDAGEGKAGATMQEFLAKSVGGVRAEEIRDRLEPGVTEMDATRRRLDTLQKQYANMPEGPERDAVLRDLTETQRLFKTQTNNLRNLAEESGILEQEGALDLTDIREQREASQVSRANRSDLLRHMFGGKRDTAEELRRGDSLLQEGPGGMAGDAGAISQIAAMRGGEDATPEKLQELERTIAEGNVDDLSEEERLVLLKSRQDRIDTRPSDDELDAYMDKFGVSEEAQGKRSVRAAFQEMASTQKRMQKTGTLASDTAHIDVSDQELNEFMAESGIDMKDIPPAKRAAVREQMMQTIRENKGAEDISLAALSESGSIDELSDRFAVLEETGVADTVRRAEKENRQRTNELLESAVLDPKFLQKTGGRGLQAIRSLESAQRTKTRLGVYYGGDSARQGLGLVDRESAANRERLSDLVLGEQATLFDKRGQLDPRYAGLSGFEGLTEADFMGDTPEAMRNRVNLGAAMIQTENLKAEEEIAGASRFMEHALGKEGMQFRLEPSGEVTRHITGGESRGLVGKEMDDAKRLQAFRNIQLGMGGAVGKIGMDTLGDIAKKDWRTMSPGEREKQIKDLSASTGASEAEIEKLTRLGEATHSLGQADDEGTGLITQIKDKEREIGRIAENFGLDKDELLADLADMEEGDAEAYVDEKFGVISEEDRTSMRMGMRSGTGRGLSEAQKERAAQGKEMAQKEAEARGMTLKEFKTQLEGGLFTEGSEGRKRLTSRLDQGQKTVKSVEEDKRNLEKQMNLKEGEADSAISDSEELEKHNKELGEEARRVAGLDKGGVIKGMAAELGLDPEKDAALITKLRKEHGAFGQSVEGRGWAKTIEKSASTVSEISSKLGMNREDAYKAIQNARKDDMTASDLAEKLSKDTGQKVTEAQARQMMGAGSQLESAGMLSALAEGKSGEDLQKHLTAQLSSLEKSKVSAEDVKERIMEIRGKVKIDGEFLHLDQTEGTTGGR